MYYFYSLSTVSYIAFIHIIKPPPASLPQIAQFFTFQCLNIVIIFKSGMMDINLEMEANNEKEKQE